MTDINHSHKNELSVNHPNFFILGAGKCGTTSLYHCLKQHPEVFMSEVKEPSFFCETFQIVKSPVEYFELYDGVKQERIIGEASHVYLTDPKSARLIKNLFPKAKFLITLKNPAERAFSLYQDMRNQQWESSKTFKSALDKEENRKTSKTFKWDNPQYFYNFLYFHSGLYGQQIQRYFSLFDSHQFHIIKLDDLKTDFDNTIHSIFDFLEVDSSIKVDKVIHNQTFKIRSSAVQRVLKRVLPESSFRQRLINHTYGLKPTLDPKLKVELMKQYSEDQKLLNSLCGIQFS